MLIMLLIIFNLFFNSVLCFRLSHRDLAVRMVLALGTIVLWLMLKISVLVHRHPKVGI